MVLLETHDGEGGIVGDSRRKGGILVTLGGEDGIVGDTRR
jgi:hypothetical protein